MRVYKVELMIVDFDEVGDDIPVVIENQRYPNYCISPHVVKMEHREIGEWHDDHPLNKRDSFKKYYEELFSKDEQIEN